jgi:cell division protein FtsZ
MCVTGSNRGEPLSVIIFGCGGSGCNIVSGSGGLPSETVNVSSEKMPTILLEPGLKDCRGDPALGWTLASEKTDTIKERMSGYSDVMAVCVLGGGVGSGSLSVILKCARSLKLRSVAVVGLPFSFETDRREKALGQLNNVIRAADRTLIFDMDRALDAVEEPDIKALLEKTNRLMCDAMKRVSEMMEGPFLSLFTEKAYTVSYDDSKDPEKAAKYGMIKGFTDSDPSHGKIIVSTDSEFTDADHDMICDAICDQTGILPEIVPRKNGTGYGMMEFIPIAYRSL